MYRTKKDIWHQTIVMMNAIIKLTKRMSGRLVIQNGEKSH